MNAVAGGGSFVTFPVLVLAGLPPIAANASSTVALFPGTMASTWAYRDDLRGIGGIGLKVLLPISLAGGLIGAILLLVTPGGVFDVVIPWLLLLATLTFAGGRRLGDWLRRHVRIGRGAFLVIQFILSIYGGYFGGAVGLMMMAVWTLLDSAELKAMAAPRAVAGQHRQRGRRGVLRRGRRGVVAGDAGDDGFRHRRRLLRRPLRSSVAGGGAAVVRGGAECDGDGRVLPADVSTGDQNSACSLIPRHRYRPAIGVVARVGDELIIRRYVGIFEAARL